MTVQVSLPGNFYITFHPKRRDFWHHPRLMTPFTHEASKWLEEETASARAATLAPPADSTDSKGKWRETHSETPSWSHDPLGWLASGWGSAGPPTGASASEHTRPKATVVNLTFPQTRGSVLVHPSGNECRGLTENTPRKFAPVLCFLALKWCC